MRLAMHHCALLAGLLLAACGYEDATRAGDSSEIDITLTQVVEELGVARYLKNLPDSVASDGDVEIHTYDPAGPARCLHGTPYKVSVRRGSSPNVLFYMQGGGACWDKASCITAPMTREFAEDFSATKREVGIFSSAVANPMRDWSVVFAAYCDGSLWLGDNAATYGDQIVYHRGMANAAAAVALLKREFPNPGKIAIAGSSAGGFGTLMGYIIARHALPDAQLYVLNDSGPWRFNEENEAMVDGVAANWRSLDVSAFSPPACPTCRYELYRVADWAMRQDRSTRWGLFSFDRDAVIADIYMKFGPLFPLILTETIDFLATRNPGQFEAFVAEGYEHTRVGTDAFYEEERSGLKLADWVAALLYDRADWVSVPRSSTNPYCRVSPVLLCWGIANPRGPHADF